MPIASVPPAARRSLGACGRRPVLLWLFSFVGGLAAFAAIAPAEVQESRTLVIPANDGYGFEECLKTNSACGLVVADAWCKAHGFAGSSGFRPTEQTSATAAPPGSFNVTCGGRLN